MMPSNSLDYLDIANEVGVSHLSYAKWDDVLIHLKDGRTIRIAGQYDPELWIGWDDSE